MIDRLEREAPSVAMREYRQSRPILLSARSA
jgi:hypothetical protein